MGQWQRMLKVLKKAPGSDPVTTVRTTRHFHHCILEETLHCAKNHKHALKVVLLNDFVNRENMTLFYDGDECEMSKYI